MPLFVAQIISSTNSSPDPYFLNPYIQPTANAKYFKKMHTRRVHIHQAYAHICFAAYCQYSPCSTVGNKYFNRIYNRLSIVSNPEMSSRMWEYSVGHIHYMPFHISELIIMDFGLHMGFKSPSPADTEGLLSFKLSYLSDSWNKLCTSAFYVW